MNVAIFYCLYHANPEVLSEFSVVPSSGILQQPTKYSGDSVNVQAKNIQQLLPGVVHEMPCEIVNTTYTSYKSYSGCLSS